MSKYVTLKVADTRFAVICSHPSFNRWLSETCRGFQSQEEPHLRVNLSLSSIPTDHGESNSEGDFPPHFLSVDANWNGHNHSELELRVVCSEPIQFFWPALQLCIRSAIPAKKPPDLLLHSSGIVHEGLAYLFAGPSGAGKSTVCNILANDPAFTVLHDDVVAIAQTEEGFYAWSTPLSGEMPAEFSVGAPLRTIFFLKQDQGNYTTRVSGRKAVSRLATHLLPPLGSRNGQFTIEPAESLKVLLTMAERTPFYELHFRPDSSFWQCIRQLSNTEPATTTKKGK